MSRIYYQKLRRRFVWGQILRGLIAILVIAGLLWFFHYLFEEHLLAARCYLLGKQRLVYLSFLLSEVMGSLFPPEVFILTLQHDSIWVYLGGVLLLSIISYFSGVLLCFVGHLLRRTLLFRRFIARFYKRELRQLKRFGGLLIVLAAITPISFTVICMLVGATGFSFRYFMVYASMRYIRFVILAYTVWHMTPKWPC